MGLESRWQHLGPYFLLVASVLEPLELAPSLQMRVSTSWLAEGASRQVV